MYFGFFVCVFFGSRKVESVGRNFYCAFRAIRGAIEAQDAAREVERFIFGVDALRLAVALAQSAGDAFFCVEREFEKREFCKEPEPRPNGA